MFCGSPFLSIQHLVLQVLCFGTMHGSRDHPKSQLSLSRHATKCFLSLGLPLVLLLGWTGELLWIAEEGCLENNGWPQSKKHTFWLTHFEKNMFTFQIPEEQLLESFKHSIFCSCLSLHLIDYCAETTTTPEEKYRATHLDYILDAGPKLKYQWIWSIGPWKETSPPWSRCWTMRISLVAKLLSTMHLALNSIAAIQSQYL